jgi:hypothetical protein
VFFIVSNKANHPFEVPGDLKTKEIEMKGLMNKLKQIDVKELANDALELSVGAVGMTSVGIIEGSVYVGKQVSKGSVTAWKKSKESLQNVDVQQYKDKAKGFVVKESK